MQTTLRRICFEIRFLFPDAESVICAFVFRKLLIYSNLYFESFFQETNWGQKFANQKKKYESFFNAI